MPNPQAPPLHTLTLLLPTPAQDSQYCPKKSPPHTPATGATHNFLPSNHTVQAPVAELVYRGPKPIISKFIQPDLREFARLCLALENLLPPD